MEVGGCSIIIIMINNISNAPSQMSPRHKKSTANKMFEGAGVGVGGVYTSSPKSLPELTSPPTDFTHTNNEPLCISLYAHRQECSTGIWTEFSLLACCSKLIGDVGL